MKKLVMDYFKTEGDYYAFALLYMDGEKRTSILGITPNQYRDKIAARAWALWLSGLVKDNEDALRSVLRIYRRMIGDPEAELPEKAGEEKAEPEKAEKKKAEPPKKAEKKAEDAWVFEYMAKDGKTLESLEKAVMKMSKNEIMERFGGFGWGLVTEHTKNEMLSIILMELQAMGYSYDGRKPELEEDGLDLDSPDQMDPTIYAREHGLDGLEEILGRMDRKQLKRVVTIMGLNYLYGNAGEEKLRAVILEQTRSRLLKGDGFLLA